MPSSDDDGVARLTGTLQASGALDGGRVVGVTVEASRRTALSTIEQLRLHYVGATGPATLIRKIPRTDVAPDLAALLRKEIHFYAEAAPATPPGLLVQCYGIGGLDGGPAWLLLEDLTDSHVSVGAWPLPPTVEQCERIMDTYATLHAHWWGHPQLGVSVGAWLDVTGALDRSMGELATRFAAFADRLADRLSRERRVLYERLLTAAPRLLARYRTHRDLTLIHGDAHVWNALHPRDPRDSIRLIDWDDWRVDTATDDLAYMIALHWYPDRRRRLERRLLERYHATLTARGVGAYPFAALLDDYRRSVLWQVATPVWQASLGITAAVWWSHLERIMLAVDDLDCRALLD
jgi:hypothetical protein